MRAKKKLAEKKKTYEESKAHSRRCIYPTYSNMHIVRSKGINVAGQVHCQRRVTRHVFSPCELRLHSLELQEKVEALLLKNPLPGSEEHQVHHIMQCHAKHATTIPAIRHCVETIGGLSIRGVNLGRMSFGDDGFYPYPVDSSSPEPRGHHDEIGGVEKAEGSQ